MSEPATCPRRMEESGPWERKENLDQWDNSRDVPGMRTCSFCGSMNPNEFMAKVEAGVEVGPTDKSYKCYVQLDTGINPITVTEDTGPRSTFTRTIGGVKQMKFYYQHLNEAQMLRFIELLNTRQMKIGLPGHFYVRPFFCVSMPKP